MAKKEREAMVEEKLSEGFGVEIRGCLELFLTSYRGGSWNGPLTHCPLLDNNNK